jgi:hypothetical protein
METSLKERLSETWSSCEKERSSWESLSRETYSVRRGHGGGGEHADDEHR